MQAEFEEYEDKTGLKFAFNIFPKTKSQESKCVIPISCLYQPLKLKNDPVLINTYPIACTSCDAIINPFCIFDINSRQWSCSVCNRQNQLHPSLPNRPTEILDPSMLDVEYVLPENQALQYEQPIPFVYVIDLSLDDNEFESLIESLIESLSMLPESAFVNLITFGKNVNIFELAVEDHNSAYTFNGTKSYTDDELCKKLGLMKKIIGQGQLGKLSSQENRFFQRSSICEYVVSNLLRSLKRDTFPVEKYNRKFRSTGTAINIAFQLLNILYPKVGAKILLFTGGVATVGPGCVVPTSFKEPIRSHNDLIKDTKVKKKFNDNKFFYNNIAERASINGHSIDIFIGCYDQVGLYEMESLVDKTGGVIVQSDSFTSAIFKQSFKKFLSRDENGDPLFGLNATMSVKCKNIMVKSFIGHATPLHLDNKKNPSNKVQFHSKNIKDVVGHSGTSIFKLGSVSTHSTYALYFELNENVAGAYSIIQFITSYQHIDGTRRVHVTTSQRLINPSYDTNESIIGSFDQEAATVLVARMAVWKVLYESTGVALKFINKILIDFLSSFSQYRINDAKSIVLPPNSNLLPQFMYHLRRSNFIQIFNSSPDETTFYRHCLLTEDCINSLIMIQPTLTSYEIEKPEPEPVLLDSTSIKPNRILFLDTFFHILIYHGSLIADWRRQGYQDLPEYDYFKNFLQLPRQEAADILIDRFPLPRFIDTEEGGSQARFLMSKLNPTTSYKTSTAGSLQHFAQFGNTDESGAVILTDDISLQTFMQYVCEAVVKPM